ncbi:hypothetical protein J3Q64DRAFT_1700669 [Phycomyces blakesleeanus]|uniref:Uncharacterized protein n=2 Tax=Phycomyces blakesleeanus TaxID=4837 RepID=A0A163AEY4_PHYB8|nr:hypothetical protein PHYBLDRAFT_169269 [Phycomyces blakesleeanus NRRL 1555(-)]OAD73011.1 hypothetical protein PHYBLDRAFT_169269 [Phycomyces blakesleeanus NRRL 1555(-)]|eukprot:XP_018291051.1 hypothetical protein PHYBLDRAFT_169269 [Phycomyces blakesleeanus NRRL 1555(-)]
MTGFYKMNLLEQSDFFVNSKFSFVIILVVTASVAAGGKETTSGNTPIRSVIWDVERPIAKSTDCSLINQDSQLNITLDTIKKFTLTEFALIKIPAGVNFKTLLTLR